MIRFLENNLGINHANFRAIRKNALLVFLIGFFSFIRTVSLTWAAEAEEVTEYKDKDGLRTLIDPGFTAPATLEELNSMVKKWEPGEIKDALKLYEAYLAKEPAPIPFEEALKLKNDGDVNNNKIKAAMRVLPSAKYP